MRRAHIIIAAAAVLAVSALLAWQFHRERLIAQCVDEGGRWLGTRSVCEPDPNRIVIMRRLQRT